MLKLTKIPILSNCQVPNGIACITVIIKKIKSKHLVCLSFLWWQVFLKEHIPIPGLTSFLSNFSGLLIRLLTQEAKFVVVLAIFRHLFDSELTRDFKDYQNLIKISSDFYFTVASWFSENNSEGHGEGSVKNLSKCPTSFMDGSLHELE